MTKVAAIQMVSGADLHANLAATAILIQQAAQQGAEMVVLPENFAMMKTQKMFAVGLAEKEQKGPIRRFLSAQANANQLFIVAGSLPLVDEESEAQNKVRSACFLYDKQGAEIARYDKIHLFDVKLDDAQSQYSESSYFLAGNRVVDVDTSVGRLGLAICYDLRFPELFRQLQEREVQIFTLPSAFTKVTGEAHWQALLRARAIENQCYMVAANQGGRHGVYRETYGHSMIVDPWGKILAQQETGPGVVLADIDLGYLQGLREQMPCVEHRRV